MQKYYTGVGSRDIPEDVENIFRMVGRALARKGFILRSGSADGSDKAFELGASDVDPNLTEIYLPNKTFKSRSRIQGVNYLPLVEGEIESAEKIYSTPTNKHKDGIMPWFNKIQRYNQEFHARNVLQVTGRNGVDSSFCIYYAPVVNGDVVGGTRSAVELCKSKGIPTYNLFHKHVKEAFLERLKESE